MYISDLRVCKANTLQTRTTAVRDDSEIPVGVNRGDRYEARVKINRRRIFDTLRIFSSGKDAAGLNRSDVSTSAETRYQKCTRMYTFDDATK